MKLKNMKTFQSKNSFLLIQVATEQGRFLKFRMVVIIFVHTVLCLLPEAEAEAEQLKIL